MAYHFGAALELDRSRNKNVTASLAASSAAALPSRIAMKAPMPRPTTTPSAAFQPQQAGQLARSRTLATSPAPPVALLERVEFEGAARFGFKLLILLNAIGDLLDLSIVLFGVGELVSVVTDGILLPINMFAIGFDPKNAKVLRKGPFGWIAKRCAIDFIPGVSIFYLRSWAIYKLYKAKVRAAEEGLPIES